MRIGLRILLGTFFIVALAALLITQVFVAQVKPGVRLYYKAGDEYDELSHYPGGGCGD